MARLPAVSLAAVDLSVDKNRRHEDGSDVALRKERGAWIRKTTLSLCMFVRGRIIAVALRKESVDRKYIWALRLRSPQGERG